MSCQLVGRNIDNKVFRYIVGHFKINRKRRGPGCDLAADLSPAPHAPDLITGDRIAIIQLGREAIPHPSYDFSFWPSRHRSCANVS